VAKSKLIKPPKGTKIPQFWSLSRYNTWRGCAYKYLLQHILKYPEKKGYAMERGIRIHLLMEEYLKGNIRGMPDELKSLSKEIRAMKKLGVKPEDSWTLTKEFEKTHPKDWNRAWLRAKIDVHHYFEDDNELLIVDLKTGRVNIAVAQMDLYAAMSQFYYPDAKNITVELWFADHDHVEPKEYDPREAKRLWNRWVRRSADMLSDRKFLPSPGKTCNQYGGCPYRSDKVQPDGETMGPCEEWKKIERGD